MAFIVDPTCDCGPVPMFSTAWMMLLSIAVVAAAALVGIVLKRRRRGIEEEGADRESTAT